MDGPMMHRMWGMGGWMILWWIFLAAIIIAITVTVARQGKARSRKSALDLLKERYARGEISREEFEEKRRDIA